MEQVESYGEAILREKWSPKGVITRIATAIQNIGKPHES